MNFIDKDYYSTLGVNIHSSQKEIKTAYRKLALRYHPDRVTQPQKKESAENFKKIAEAYYVLGDMNRRHEYDNHINTYDIYENEQPDQHTEKNTYAEQHYNFDDIMVYVQNDSNWQFLIWKYKYKTIAILIFLLAFYFHNNSGAIYQHRLSPINPIFVGLCCILFESFLESGTDAGAPGCVFSLLGWIVLLGGTVWVAIRYLGVS